MRRASTLAVPALVLALAVAVAVAAQGRSSEAPDPATLVLRLPDLPRGYVVDSRCSGLGVEDMSPALRAVVLEHRPRVCVREFGRSYGPVGPPTHGAPLVESFALGFRSEDGAETTLRLLPELLRFLFGLRSVAAAPPPPGLGHDPRAFAASDALVGGRAGRPAIVVAWRRGPALAGVLVGGLSGQRARAAAAALATIQQRHGDNPRPPIPADTDDRTVPLDHPRLGVPVYWLGKSLAADGDLPALELEQSFTTLEPGSGPGSRLELHYGGPTASVRLGLWTPARWRTFRRTELGRLVSSSPCARSRRIRVPRGHAIVYAGYYERRTPRPCPRRAHDYFLAHVFLPRVVVSVNIPICLTCVELGAQTANRYNSLAGMATVARNLRQRPRS